jgi:hypothetical protein
MSTNPDSTGIQKKWCVMVYLAADIDLESAAIADLEQMKAAGSSREVDLLAQVNPGGSRAIRRYHLQRDTYLQEDLVTHINEDGDESLLHNVNAKQDLIDFVEWCANRSKAAHYALILWGHGQGWKSDNPDPCFIPGAGNPHKSIQEQLKKAETGNVNFPSDMPLHLPTTLLNGETGFLTNEDLREALIKAKVALGNKNIDILGMDACLMAMAEICCQVDLSVNYLVACEDTVPDESWPYDSILKLLVENSDVMTAEDFARVIVWKFIFDFGRKRKFVTQSICQLGNDNGASLKNFTSALQRLVQALLSEMKDPETRWATMVARSQVQSFFMKDYVDIFDFCRLLCLNCKNPWVIKACEDVMNALHGAPVNGSGLSERLVIDHGTYGYPLKCSFGVSVFFPCVGEIPACYPKLEFCERTKWHEFISVFLRSPQGKAAVFEAESEGEWPNEVVTTADEKPAVVPAAHTVGDVNVATTVKAPAVVLTATGVLIGGNGNMKSAHSHGLKTTYGDIVKTSHGDPIKKPGLPSWILPSPPAGTADRRAIRSDRSPKVADETKKCSCGNQS